MDYLQGMKARDLLGGFPFGVGASSVGPRRAFKLALAAG